MKNLIFILIILPFFALGQQNKDRVDQFALDIFFSPDFYQPVEEYPGKRFLHPQSYSFGTNVIWHFQEKPNLSIRSGIKYALYHEKVEYRIEHAFPLSFFIVSNKISYFEIPLAFRHYFFRKKLSGYSEILVSLNTGNKENYLNPHLAWGISLGLEYALNTRFSAFLQPTFRKPFEKNDIYSYSKGIEMGLRFKSKKH